MKVTCHFCKREFKSHQSLGLHQMHARKATAKGRRNRICPDRRDDAEARDTALRITRLKGKLGVGAFSGSAR